MPFLDKIIVDFDRALRVMGGIASASRPNPASRIVEAVLDADQQRHSAGLMRINHVGEVCAQALYDAQARFAHDPSVKQQFIEAGREEEDHLAWTAERVRELGSHIVYSTHFGMSARMRWERWQPDWAIPAVLDLLLKRSARWRRI